MSPARGAGHAERYFIVNGDISHVSSSEPFWRHASPDDDRSVLALIQLNNYFVQPFDETSLLQHKPKNL